MSQKHVSVHLNCFHFYPILNLNVLKNYEVSPFYVNSFSVSERQTDSQTDFAKRICSLLQYFIPIKTNSLCILVIGLSTFVKICMNKLHVGSMSVVFPISKSQHSLDNSVHDTELLYREKHILPVIH
jgi:hypothetical protein